MRNTATIRVFIAATAFGAAALPLAAYAAAKENAGVLWEAMARCAAMADGSSRHACTDEVLASVGLLTDIQLTAEKKQEFGLSKQQEKQKKKKEALAAAVIEESNDDEITVTLSQIEVGRSQRLTLTTADGAIWKQVDGDAIRPTPQAGQTMTIQKASLGGYICKTGKWSSFRCKRQY